MRSIQGTRNAPTLRSLLLETKDGEWGKGEPGDGLVEMAVIRGTDFEAVSMGDLSRVPRRFLSVAMATRKVLKDGDVLIETAGGTKDQPTGRTLFISEKLVKSSEIPLTCASFSRFMRPDPALIEPEFLYWYMQWLYATGRTSEYHVQHTGVARFQFTDFSHATEINLPTRDEQRRVVAVLSSLNRKIEINRRMAATLEEMARAVFRSWFVDFDPVRAKIAARDEGRDPERAAMAVLSGKSEVDLDTLPAETLASLSATAALFPGSFQDSIGDLPAGWSAQRLSDLCTIGRGASPRPINDYMGGDVPWIKIADATATIGPFLLKTKEKVTSKGALKSVTVKPGDLILSNSATCGVPVFVEVEGCIHDGWLYFKNLRCVSRLYLYHSLKGLAEELIQIADGSVQKNLNTELVGKQILVVPSPSVIQCFEKLVGPMFAKIRQTCFETVDLEMIRDSLLPQLLSGSLSPSGEGSAE